MRGTTRTYTVAFTPSAWRPPSATRVPGEKISGFIGSPSSENVIFTRNTTEGINLVANTWALANINPGDEILLTEMEHHSNLVPWQKLARDKGAKLRFIPVAPDGTLNLAELDQLLNHQTRLLSLVHMSNVSRHHQPGEGTGSQGPMPWAPQCLWTLRKACPTWHWT